ncbi:MAG: XRE family transcriptional regulator [Planctomycetota bacterium]|nr:MAG: XRE family transcriptional regulator [Planctomycetota bacterium]
MISSTMPSPRVMHQAVCERDKSFEGVFWLGVTSTRIFCRPGCPARTPKPENLRFFPSVAESLAHGFRPCRRCRPLERCGETPDWLRPLLAEVEKDPARRWRDAELQAAGFHPVRVRRWFQSQHGMTFHGYLRARRLGAALGKIGEGEPLLNAGFDAGYESVSGFREAFEKMFRLSPGRARNQTALVVRPLTTPLGMMVAAATDTELCFLEFHDRRAFEAQVKTLARRAGATYSPGDNAILQQTELELEEYFAGTRLDFDVPMAMPGSDWERSVWEQLLAIPYGETCAYSDIAKTLKRPKASRAVGTANGRNRLTILVPCHRVIRADGSLSGYGGGLWRKQKLLDHEREVRGAS